MLDDGWGAGGGDGVPVGVSDGGVNAAEGFVGAEVEVAEFAFDEVDGEGAGGEADGGGWRGGAAVAEAG